VKVLGIMSGTSADGADLVLARLEGRPPSLTWSVLEHRAEPYPVALRSRVLAALYARSNTQELAVLHHDLGRFYAEAAQGFAGQAELVALHGQTVWHQPLEATLQIGEAAHLASQLRVPVVADFRPADLALGGEAAPLVAYPDLLLYGQEGVRRAVHNLGGISNLTYLPGLDARGVFAFDTGPANCLIDEAAQRLGQSFDPAGQLSRQGRVDSDKLSAWLAHPYFRRPPPKSTGREIWTFNHLEAEGLRPHDLLATTTALTAQSIVQAYRDFVLPLGLDEVWIAGGGVYNQALLEQIRAGLGVPVYTFEERGHDSRVREALAFAVLGYLRHLGLPNVLPRVTGARQAAVAGKISLPGVEGWPD
jgi:anhydro-N-acetylmuramic acid kinase